MTLSCEFLFEYGLTITFLILYFLTELIVYGSHFLFIKFLQKPNAYLWHSILLIISPLVSKCKSFFEKICVQF